MKLSHLLVLGATAVISMPFAAEDARRPGSRPSQRKPPKLAAVVLADEIARLAWKLMLTGETYAATSAPIAPAAQHEALSWFVFFTVLIYSCVVRGQFLLLANFQPRLPFFGSAPFFSAIRVIDFSCRVPHLNTNI